VILLSHPTANPNVRQAARALAEARLLKEFWTCTNWVEGSFLDRALFLSPRLRSELRRRSFADEIQPFIRTYPAREWARLFFGQLGLGGFTVFGADAIVESLDRRVARRLIDAGVSAVYAYDGGALESFRAAKDRRVKCVYEHPIIYWKKVQALQREEAELHPEWASTLLALRDSEEKLHRKDEELALADLIIVPSTFSKISLIEAGISSARVRVIPYSAPSVAQPIDSRRNDDKLRVLFAGALSQAKGLGYLLEAASKMSGKMELTLIGRRMSPAIPDPKILDRHRWLPSLPHHQLLDEMGRHDVLALPSLHEGFGLVVLEAMAQGIPVIATANTGAADVIENEVDGFIVPIRSSDAIAEKLELLHRDRGRLAKMKETARVKASTRSWQTYRDSVAALAREVMAS
jgi:starch synthase